MSAINRAMMVKGIAIDASTTLTGTAKILVPRGAVVRCIEIYNPNMVNAIAISHTSTTPAVNAAGSITIAPLGTWRTFEGFVPATDLYVNGANGSLVTCWYF